MNIVILILALFYSNIMYAETPAWTIDCNQITRSQGEKLTVQLYRTGHPMAGLYSYSGLIFFKNTILMTEFSQLTPPTLQGIAKNLENSEYSLELDSKLLNTNKNQSAKLKITTRDPFNNPSLTFFSFNCLGHY